MDSYDYFAFVSYKREDEEWAKWLQNELERYRLPASFRKRDTSLPRNIRPIFRDSTELSGGVLTEKLGEALQASKYLIVICSPRSAQSVWVNEEVDSFINSGRINQIIPFIVEGVPNADHQQEECFPASLRKLSPQQELLGVNTHEMGKDAAVVKVISQMLGLRFDSLWQRHERRKRRNTAIIVGVSVLFALLGLLIGLSFFHKNKHINALNQELLAEETRFVSKNAEPLLANADTYRAMKIAKRILPQNLERPDRPYLPEAESLLRNAFCSNIHRICDHSRYVSFSPDDKYLLTTTSGTEIWDINTGEKVYGIPDFYPIVVSDDWSRMISEGFVDIETVDFRSTFDSADCWNRCVYERDTLSSDLIHSNAQALAMNHSKDKLVAAHWSGSIDGKTDRMGSRVILWDVPSKRVLWSYDCPNEMFKVLAFSPEGEYVCGGSDENTIKLWDAATGQLLYTFQGHLDSINCLCFYSGGKRLVSASDDGTLKIWDIKSKRLMETLKGHSGEVSALVLSADGRTIISADKNGEFILWDAHSGERMREYSSGFNGIRPLAASRDGKMLAFGCNKGTYVLNLRNEGMGTLLLDSLSNVNSIRFSPDGNKLFVGSGSRKMIAFDCSSKKEIWRISYPGTPEAFYEDFNEITVSSDGSTVMSNLDSLIVEWECDSGKERSVYNFGEKVFSVAQSPTGQYLVISSVSGITVWTSKEKEFLYQLKEIGYDRTSVPVFNPVEESFSMHGYIWNLATGDLVFEQPHEDFYRRSSFELKRNAFSPDGLLFVMADIFPSFTVGGYEVRNAIEGEMVRTFKREHYWRYGACAFSPDSKLIACGDGDRVRIWDISSGVLLCELFSYEDSPRDYITMLDFSPNGRYIASGTQSGRIRIWSYPSLQEIIQEIDSRFSKTPLSQQDIDKYIRGKNVD